MVENFSRALGIVFFTLVGVYPVLTIFHLYSSLLSLPSHQPISARFVLQPISGVYYFNVTFFYKYNCSFILF